MNYTIEGNIDFYAELLKDDDATATATDPVLKVPTCLITHEPLDRHSVTLPCNHGFNYMALYKEIYIQKIIVNSNELTKLEINQIKCPYCREKFDLLIPYVRLAGITKVKGVNDPAQFCLGPVLACNWILKNGAKKNTLCPNSAYAAAVPAENYCDTHWKLFCKNTSIKMEEPWTAAMQKMYKQFSVPDLKALLKTKHLKVGGTKKALVRRLM